jgi:regulator of protease activity HflC (stomatin/prohibitin superfamily)
MIPAIRSIIREVGRSVPLAQNLANAEVQQRLQTEIETKLNEYLSAKGFKVFDVLIRDVNLPEVVKKAVVATKEREEQIEREKATLKVIEQQAQQQVVQAEAKAKAAEQQAIAIETLAKAEAFRILTEAEATAKGNDLVNKSLTKDLINYAEANKWDGKLPTTMIPNSATPIIGVK